MKGNKSAQISLLLGMLLAGCSAFGGQGSPTANPEPLYTQAAQTIVAGLTEAAPPVVPTALPPVWTATLLPTQPPLSTNTPAPTSTPVPTSTPTQLPTATPVVWELVYEEDFSEGSNWAELEGDGWAMGYSNGGYLISVDLTYAPIWSIRNQDFDDISLEVDAARTAGPQNGYYGLVCRHLDGENYYALVVAEDGFVGIGIVEEGEKLRFLQEGNAPEGVLKPEGTPNHLRADCIGDSLVLYANGVKVVEVVDTTFDSGVSGLLAGTRQEAGLRVLFDNLTARVP
jgi:hypothetical protein